MQRTDTRGKRETGIRADERWLWAFELGVGLVVLGLAIYRSGQNDPIAVAYAAFWIAMGLRDLRVLRTYQRYLTRARELRRGGPFLRYRALTRADPVAALGLVVAAILAVFVLLMASLLLPPEWSDSPALTAVAIFILVLAPAVIFLNLRRGTDRPLSEARRLFGRAVWARGTRHRDLIDDLVAAVPDWVPSAEEATETSGRFVFVDDVDDPFSDAESS